MRPVKKNDAFILNKEQIEKVFLATSILIFALYLVAMVFSLCGSKYFILNYQNTQMDKIESWFANNHISILIHFLFSTFEFYIVLCFVLKKIAKIWYPMVFYATRILLSIPFEFSNVVNIIYPFIFYLLIPLLDQLIDYKRINIKEYGKSLLRLVIGTAITVILQAMILVIKAGYFDGQNHVMNLSATFIYAIEYDIALLVILFTISLLINREKGDSQCTTDQQAGGSSQTSKNKLRKQNTKPQLNPKQKNKIRWIYFKMYLIQLGTFFMVMVLPFLLGKVLEFLVMYVAFAISRYLLGFQYSLHFKKESLCVGVSLIVFGILSLAVPFFYIVLILAVMIGTALAVLLHLSYKYKSLYLFNKMTRPDRFAELYVLMDGDLSPHHVGIICRHRGLSHRQVELMVLFAEGNKKSFLAKKYKYVEKSIDRQIDDCLIALRENS